MSDNNESNSNTFLLIVGGLLIVGLMYVLSPASDPDYQRCMLEMTGKGIDDEDAMRICN